MNTINVNKLFDNYITKFDVINDDANREYYKWEAVKHFKDNWDINAPDFAGMFKEAVRLTSVLLNNHIVQPANGIIKLAERPELTEIVRKMFKDLFSDDGGDIDARQDRIYAFLAKADELLNTYEKGKWKYAQDMRTAITYLNLMYPEQNYLFKATQAREFMYCSEFTNDFGSGENFSLKKYYMMCDELVEEIKSNKTLIDLHNNRISPLMYNDDNYHILAYDIIYAGITYNLYSDIAIVKPQKTYTKAQQNAEKRILLSKQLEDINNELALSLQQRATFDSFSAKGLEVTHKTYGDGFVIEHNEQNVTVRFDSCDKKFQLPQGFTDGFLKIESEEIMTLFTEMANYDETIKKLKSKQKVIKTQLSGLQL